MLANLKNKVLKAIGGALGLLTRVLGRRASNAEAAWAFVEAVMVQHHFTSGARKWLRENINLRVDDMRGTGGGGFWRPLIREVQLFTAQHEAAVHELAHAWWQDRRLPLKNDMIRATVRLSTEQDPKYAATTKLANEYVYGIPEQPWAGMVVECNDWEMFAGFASGTMGDMSKLPPYVRKLYAGLFEMPREE